MRRFINEEGSWNTHIKNTKDFIQECALKHKNGKVAILGSGWLLDVPLDFLVQNFQSIVLYDIFHPKQIEFKIKKYPNISTVQCDLTGGIITNIYNNRRTIGSQFHDWLNNLKTEPLNFLNQFDFVISLNLLNQLDIIPADYLKDKLEVNENHLDRFRKQIQEKHIDNLPDQKSCIITDVKEIKIDDNNIIKETKNLIYATLIESGISREWTWHFDTKKTFSNNFKTYLQVKAFEK